MNLRTSIIIFSYLIFIGINTICAQNKNKLYDWSRFFIDKNNVYTYGTKYINASFKNRSIDGYEHNRDFYLLRYDSMGKKLSETLVNKNRDFMLSSELVKKRHSLYTLLAFINRNPDLYVSYYNHFLVQFDTLGNVTREFKIENSTYTQFNSVFYGSEFIYITFIGKKIVCEKYDYNFKLVEKITDPLITSFLYGGRVYETKNGVVCFGSFNNMEELNKKVEKRWLNTLFFDGSNFCVKKIGSAITSTPKMQITSFTLPTNDIFISSFQDGNKLFCTTYDKNYTKTQKEKLYVYDSNANKLELITDTIGSCSKLIYVKVLSEKDLILFGYGNAIGGSGELYWCPDMIYYIKNGQLKSCFKMENTKPDNYSQGFKLVGKELYIYQMNDFGENIKIKIYNYENNVLLK